VSLLGGCASLKPGWKDLSPSKPSGDPAAEISRARALFLDADGHDKLTEVIQTYEAALERDPANYDVLTALCEAYVLDAAAYAPTKKEKKVRYRAGIAYCDRAMYTNPQFRRLIDQGAPLDEAAQVLTRAEADAMMFWVTGVSYYFKECMGGLARLSSYPLIRKTETFLTRMMEIDPDFENGVVHFSRGIYYLGLPKFAGGDREESARLMKRAEEVGPTSMLVRWGRAKYYHFETKNREAFERDLRWVVEQDLRQSATPYAWNVYFQRDAAEMLKNVERLF
jgi:tetratricopeptide (TPR) repeat protein